MARLREIKGDHDSADESAILSEWLAINSDESEIKKRLKDAESALDKKAYEQYGRLDESDIKSMVVDAKWLSHLRVSISGEIERVSQWMTTRLKVLAERYESVLPVLTTQVTKLEALVEGHLSLMGFSWK
jgi:type I restriction enzyme M protein